MNRKRIVILLGILTLCGLTALTIVTLLKNRVGTINVTNLVMANVANIDSLSDKNYNFFTGSAIASVDLTKSGTLISNTVTRDTPYAQIYKVDYRESSKTLLAQILHTSDDLYTINGVDPSSGPQQVWLLQNGTQQPTLFDPFHKSKTIIDARLTRDGIVLLTNDGSTNNDLYIYTNKLKEIANNVSDNQIVGVFENSVVTRDQKGKTNIYSLTDPSDHWSINTTSEKVFVDKTTDTIVVQHDKNTIYLYNNRKQKSAHLNEQNIFVTKGYIIALDATSLPKQMAVINLANGKEHTYKTGVVTESLNEDIQGAVIINPDIPTFGLVSASNSLLIASADKDVTDSVKTYVFPTFHNDALVNFDVGSAQATIYSTNIPQSLKLLTADCKCDINQVHKYWQKTSYSNPYQPTLDEPDEDY